MRKSLWVIAVLLLLVVIGNPRILRADGTQLITNGSFGTGDLTGWTETDETGGSGSWFVLSGTTEPVSGLTTVGPDGTTNYASSDQTGPGAHALIQSFTVPLGTTSVDLSWDMFINDLDGTFCTGLDYTVPEVECGTVAILAAGSNPLTTTTGVVDSIFTGTAGATAGPNGWVGYNAVITNLTPGTTYELQFAEADNQSFFDMGIDNVSLVATGNVPEPATSGLMLLGVGLLLVMQKRLGARLHQAN